MLLQNQHEGILLLFNELTECINKMLELQIISLKRIKTLKGISALANILV